MRRELLAGVCVLVAVFCLWQFLGLLMIQRISDRHARGERVFVPLSVRFVAEVADRMHERTLSVKLKPDGSNWPGAFRAFFIVEMCGLAGLCWGFVQLASGLLARKREWKVTAGNFFGVSLLLIVMGVCFLRLL